MDDSSRIYIDEKFKELNNNVRTFIVIFIGILTTFGGVIGFSVKMAYANKQEVETIKLKQESIVIEQEKLEYMMEWSVELSEIQRDFIKAIADDKDVSGFLDKLEEIEKRIYGSHGLPSYRGNDDYKSGYKKLMEERSNNN